ncbi:MAG: lipopolysaccharide heptosyltransferase II [Nitrospiraceae bacterium]
MNDKQSQPQTADAMRIDQTSVKRILVRMPNWLGDAVMAEPALAAIARTFPQASITILAKPAVAELLVGHPAVHEQRIYRSADRHAGLLGKWRLSRDLSAGRFDLAILFQNAFEAALLTWLGRVPQRIGYATDGRQWLLSNAVAVPKPPPHQVRYYLAILQGAGLLPATTETGAFDLVDPADSTRRPRLYLRDDERQQIRARLRTEAVRDDEFLLGVNPGSTYGGAKRWLPDRFAATAKEILARVRATGRPARAVILGARGEEALGADITQAIGPGTLCWSGRTSIRELMAISSVCGLYVTNDTGPMHLAAALGVPLVGVFGPTDSRTTSPFTDAQAIVREPVDCAPCLLRECPIDHRCMTRVSVERVVDAADGLFSLSAQADSDALKPSKPLLGVTIYLDRDGTLIHDVGYLNDPARIEWLPGVLDGLLRLSKMGARLVLVTNQSGIGRGLITPQQVEAVHTRVAADLAAAGVTLDGCLWCPHHPDAGCACRKPAIGMVEAARERARASGAVIQREYVIGDSDADMGLAQGVGARSVRLLADAAPGWVQRIVGDYQTDRFSDAVEWIVNDVRRADATASIPCAS